MSRNTKVGIILQRTEAPHARNEMNGSCIKKTYAAYAGILF